jgi:hypothetical protein
MKRKKDAKIVMQERKVGVFLHVLADELEKKLPRRIGGVEVGGTPDSDHGNHMMIDTTQGSTIWVFPDKGLKSLEIEVTPCPFIDDDKKAGTKLKCKLQITGLPMSRVAAIVFSEFNRISRELNSLQADENRLINSIRNEKTITLARLDARRARSLGKVRTELVELVANIGWFTAISHPYMDEWNQMPPSDCRKYVRGIAKAFARLNGGISLHEKPLERAWKRQGIDPSAPPPVQRKHVKARKAA